jgi:SNF2 family DNA or RNA helicase
VPNEGRRIGRERWASNRKRSFFKRPFPSFSSSYGTTQLGIPRRIPILTQVLHLYWQPKETDDFIQSGCFRLWLETDQRTTSQRTAASKIHPRHLGSKELADWIKETLGSPVSPADVSEHALVLPSFREEPLPCPELLALLNEEYPEQAELQEWKVTGYQLAQKPINTINDLHFRLLFQGQQTRAGSDFLFWYFFTQSLKSILQKDQYIPALRYQTQRVGKSPYEIHAGWEFVSEQYTHLLKQATDWIPPGAAPGWEPASVPRHCAEVLLRSAVGQARITQALQKKIDRTFLDPACRPQRTSPWTTAQDLRLGQSWAQWRRSIVGVAEATGFQLGLQLHEANPAQPERWKLEFRAISRRDPSLQVPLSDYWHLGHTARTAFLKDFGDDFELALLLDLGHAARIYPLLWEGLKTAEPTGVNLSLEEAFAFLTETAWILEDAGFRVSVPAWWTPQGRRRAKLRMRTAPAGKKPKAVAKKNGLSLDQLLQYRYDLTLDGTAVSPLEWAELIEAKIPLVQFRGQWVALDRDRMKEMLDFWKQQEESSEPLDMRAWLQRTAEQAELFEIEPEDALAGMLDKLRNPNHIEPIENPEGLQACLRDYQKRGAAWLGFLEQLGLAGCLADDMGLGKTIQVIARLLIERHDDECLAPTLLIAPTSVVGNWRKEIERFAPSLRTLVHHGADRLKDEADFIAAARQADVTLVSYNLALRDAKLLSALHWRRIVLDEAQNIKNPEAKQTKAILKLNADYRLALTGTPVENRLLDLWSIFNFLNPGYLGRQASFRKAYETPIQRDNDPARSTLLKRLVEPFILRRVKTDPSIIKDLPDKVENKQYCNLSKEQASLYEALIRDVAQQLEESEGIQRQGLMLSTLMKLKQICNHPAQFLQDGSPFSRERSHKLERLLDMLGDALSSGESVLIFTQFTEIGEQLERHCKADLAYRTYYLHGGTPRTKREQMIEQFQDPETPPAVFILSLKAGGVGITLTRANHVFHFDRWWNPAVEDQATDRAFRIGQTKNVFVHKLITLGTLEERIDQMIEDKKKVAGAIVGNDESWLTRLDNEAFRQLIALNQAAILDD